MSNLCLKFKDTWITDEIPVVCGKGTNWFTLFEFKHGEYNYVKVWLYYRYHLSLVKAELKQDPSGKFNVDIQEEKELPKVKGHWNHGPVYYDYAGEGVRIKLSC